jgi:urease accessory protein
MTPADQWLLWQLADSAFPSGSFGHSGGLEAAMQLGEIPSRPGLENYLLASLQQITRAALPFTLDAHRDPSRAAELDETCEAFLSNHVANRGSRLMGRSFASAAQNSFPLACKRDLNDWNNDNQMPIPLPRSGRREESFPVESQTPEDSSRRPLRTEVQPPPSTTPLAELDFPYHHFAPVFGVVARLLEIDRASAARLFVFMQLRGSIASAVRLGIIGPLEAQRLQFKLSPAAETAAQQSLHLTVEDAAHSAPLLDIWQGAQDRLYSRLFQT